MSKMAMENPVYLYGNHPLMAEIALRDAEIVKLRGKVERMGKLASRLRTEMERLRMRAVVAESKGRMAGEGGV